MRLLSIAARGGQVFLKGHLGIAITVCLGVECLGYLGNAVEAVGAALVCKNGVGGSILSDTERTVAVLHPSITDKIDRDRFDARCRELCVQFVSQRGIAKFSGAWNKASVRGTADDHRSVIF